MNNENTIQVWDIAVRVFHWSLLVSFVVAYLTAEDESILHIYSGYAVLGLIVFRVLWGVIGSRYARFSDFVYSPTVVFGYLKDLVHKKPGHYIGHNPAGGWMVLALLLGLFVISVSGLKLYAIEEGRGPLAAVNVELSLIPVAHADRDEHEDRKTGNNQDEEDWEEIHELSTNLTLLLIFLHITGVVVSSRLHGENLVRAMITGKKKA